MYIDGYNSFTITSQTHIDYTNIPRLIEKCLKAKNDGTSYGYEALIPYHKFYTSFDTQQTAATFKKLLNNYPSLEDFIYFSISYEKLPRHTYLWTAALRPRFKRFRGFRRFRWCGIAAFGSDSL